MLKKVQFAISGMTCASCAARIEKGLKAAGGVQEARVNLANERAEVTFNPAEVEEKTLTQTIRDLGYEVILPREERLTVSVGGMTCAACVNRVEKTLRSLPGVVEANVNFATERATVLFDGERLNRGDFRKAIEDLGYEVRGFEGESLVDREAETRRREIRNLKRKFLFGAVMSGVFTLEIETIPGADVTV